MELDAFPNSTVTVGDRLFYPARLNESCMPTPQNSFVTKGFLLSCVHLLRCD